MEVVSTNIGEKQIVKWRGKSVATGIFKHPVNNPITLEKEDVAGDKVIDRRYHGGIDKACYLYGAQHYPFWKDKFPDLLWNWGMFGENVTVSGFDESAIKIGDIYRLGTALVQITQPRQPCFKLGIRLKDPKAVKAFVDAEKPGGYVRVLEPGKVASDNVMTLVHRSADNLTLKEVYHLLYHGSEEKEKMEFAINMTELADACRKDLMKNI